MKAYWNPTRNNDIALPDARRINVHSTQLLLARRKRLQQRLALFLAAFVGLGSLLIAVE